MDGYGYNAEQVGNQPEFDVDFQTRSLHFPLFDFYDFRLCGYLFADMRCYLQKIVEILNLFSQDIQCLLRSVAFSTLKWWRK